MLHKKAIAAYTVAAALAFGSVVLTFLSTVEPWLRSKSGTVVYLTRACRGSECVKFPDDAVVSNGFIATWKTAVFGLCLTIALDLVIGLAIVFSWVASRRKRTTYAVKYLSAASLVINLLVVQTFWSIYNSSDYFYKGWRWIPSGGGPKLALSALCLLGVFIEMFFFRGIIKRPDEADDYDSDEDEDDDIDTISIDEDLTEEERDFYIFNKQARRAALQGG